MPGPGRAYSTPGTHRKRSARTAGGIQGGRCLRPVHLRTRLLLHYSYTEPIPIGLHAASGFDVGFVLAGSVCCEFDRILADVVVADFAWQVLLVASE